MTKQTRIIPSLLAAALSVAAMPAHADTSTDEAIQAQLQDYKATMQAFGKTLKGELQAAMKEGGPMAAVQVCNERAPEIAADLSEESGYTLRRTSLKPRATPPTDWEREVLENFEARRADGEPPKAIEWHEVVSVDGDKQLRYMKAIGTEGVCLTCHGTDIDPALKAKIDKLYPEDQAVGFEEGDVRGAFSITGPIGG